MMRLLIRIFLFAVISFGLSSAGRVTAGTITFVSRADFGNTTTFSELSEFDSPGEHRPLGGQTISGTHFLSGGGGIFTTTPSLQMSAFMNGAVIEGDPARAALWKESADVAINPPTGFFMTKFGFDFAVASDDSLSNAVGVQVSNFIGPNAGNQFGNVLGIVYADAVFLGNHTAVGSVFIESADPIQMVRISFMGRVFLLDNITRDQQEFSRPTATPVPPTLVMSTILFAMFGVVWSYKRLKQTAMAA